MSSFRTYAIITKTNKELEALKVIHDSQDIQGGYDSFWEAYRIIEKAIKALEIIKEKKVFVDLLVQSENLKSYNAALAVIYMNIEDNEERLKTLKEHYLTEEEHKLLKEILK